jgi:hypothetical protein
MTKEHKNFYYGVTKEEHDELMDEKSRPLTQAPIQNHSQLEKVLMSGHKNLLKQVIRIIQTKE